MSNTAPATSPGLATLLNSVRAKAEASGVFGPVSVQRGRLVAEAKNSAEPAEFRVFADQGRVWVALVTANRWLSQSIEADLVHTGDKLEELLEEELADLGYDGKPLTFEHFRDDAKLFTFRSPLPFALDRAGDPAAAKTAATALLAYEACFRNLGDMDVSNKDE